MDAISEVWKLSAAGNPVFKPCAYFPGSNNSDIIVLTKDCSFVEKQAKGQIAFLALNHREWYEFWKPVLVGVIIYHAENVSRKFAGDLKRILRNIPIGKLTIQEKIFLFRVSRLNLKVE